MTPNPSLRNPPCSLHQRWLPSSAPTHPDQACSSRRIAFLPWPDGIMNWSFHILESTCVSARLCRIWLYLSRASSSLSPSSSVYSASKSGSSKLSTSLWRSCSNKFLVAGSIHCWPLYLGLCQELAGLDPGAGLLDEHRHPTAHIFKQLLHCNNALLAWVSFNCIDYYQAVGLSEKAKTGVPKLATKQGKKKYVFSPSRDVGRGVKAGLCCRSGISGSEREKGRSSFLEGGWGEGGANSY